MRAILVLLIWLPFIAGRCTTTRTDGSESSTFVDQTEVNLQLHPSDGCNARADSDSRELTDDPDGSGAFTFEVVEEGKTEVLSTTRAQDRALKFQSGTLRGCRGHISQPVKGCSSYRVRVTPFTEVPSGKYTCLIKKNGAVVRNTSFVINPQAASAANWTVTFYKGSSSSSSNTLSARCADSWFSTTSKGIDFGAEANAWPVDHKKVAPSKALSFCAVFKGSYTPPTTGEYRFLGSWNKGAMLKIDGTTVFDAWNSPIPSATGTISLTANSKVDVEFWYYYVKDNAGPRVNLQYRRIADTQTAQLVVKQNNDLIIPSITYFGYKCQTLDGADPLDDTPTCQSSPLPLPSGYFIPSRTTSYGRLTALAGFWGATQLIFNDGCLISASTTTCNLTATLIKSRLGGMDVYAPSSCASANKILVCKDVGSNIEVVSSPKSVTFYGKNWAVIDGTDPNAGVPSTCSAGYLRIPSGWAIAPERSNLTKLVVLQYTFGSDALILADLSAIEPKTGATAGVITLDKKTLGGIDYYGPVLNGLVPGKKCPRILLYQNVASNKDRKVSKAVSKITNIIKAGDFEYAALDNAKSGGKRSCQSSPLPVPSGWSVVPAADSNVLAALKKYKADFSADCLTFGNGRSIPVPVTGDSAGDCGSGVHNACNFEGTDHHIPNCLAKRRRVLIQRRAAAPPSVGGSASATDISVTCGVCSSTGDPHFTTYGGTKFSLYTKGKEILTRSNSSWTGTPFAIESFQVPWGSRSVTVNGRISFIVGTENVTVAVPAVQTSSALTVVTRNGATLSSSNFNPGSPKIRVSLFNNDNKQIVLTSTVTDGSGNSGDIIVSIGHSASGVHFLNFKVNMSSSIFVGKVEGICGACGDKRTWCPRNVPFAVSSTNAASNQAFGECWSNGTIPPSTAPPHPCSTVSTSHASLCQTVCSACNDTAANQEACLIDCCGSEPEQGSKTCQTKTIDDTNDGKETVPVCKVPDDFEKTKKVVRGHRCGTLNPPKTIGQLACDLDAFSDTEFQVTFVNSSFANGETTYCYDAAINPELCDNDGCDLFKHFILQTTCPTTSHQLSRDNDTGNYGVIVPLSAGQSIYCVSFTGNVFDNEGTVNMIVKGNSSKCGSAQIIAPDCTDEIPLPVFVAGDRPSHIRPSDHSHAKATPLYKALARCQSQTLGCVSFLRADGKYVGVDTVTGKPCTPAATQTNNDCHQLGDTTGVFVVKGKHTHHNTDLKEKDDFTDRNERTDKAERDDLGNKCFAVGNGGSTRPVLVPHTDVDSSFHVEVTGRCAKKGTPNGSSKNFTATCHAKLDNGDLIFVGKTDFDEDEDEHHTRVIEGSGITIPAGRTCVGLHVQFHFSGRKDGKAYFSNRVKVNAGAGHVHGGNLCGNAHFGSKLSGWTPLAGSAHEHSKDHDNTDDIQENTISSKTGSLVLKGRGGNSGVSQLVDIPADRNSVDAVFFSGYSKRITEVTGTTVGGYSLYVDIAYTDGSFDYGITAPFTAGPASNKWEYTERLYRLKEFTNGTNIPVKWVQITPLLRNYTGDVAFDNVFITVIEKCSGLPRESAFSAADPHLTTLDGHYYDVQRLGDFTLIQDSNLAINVRHSRAGQAAVNSIIRLRYKSQTDIIIERASETNDPHFSVNGASFSLNLDEKYVFGNVEVIMTGKLDRSGNFLKYEFNFPSTGHFIVVTAHVSSTQNGRQWLQVFPRFPTSSAGKTSGLLGNFNKDTSDDFTDAFGNVLPLDISVEELYERFVDSWKSPMSYIVQESFNANNPTDVIEIKSIADFPAEQVARVRQQCSVLTDNKLIEGCVLDVLLGEDESFVNAFLAVSQVNVVPQPVPLVQTQGSSAFATAVCFLTFVLSLALALF